MSFRFNVRNDSSIKKFQPMQPASIFAYFSPCKFLFHVFFFFATVWVKAWKDEKLMGSWDSPGTTKDDANLAIAIRVQLYFVFWAYSLFFSFHQVTDGSRTWVVTISAVRGACKNIFPSPLIRVHWCICIYHCSALCVLHRTQYSSVECLARTRVIQSWDVTKRSRIIKVISPWVSCTTRGCPRCMWERK